MIAPRHRIIYVNEEVIGVPGAFRYRKNFTFATSTGLNRSMK